MYILIVNTLGSHLKAASDVASAIERENERLKAHLDRAQRQLESLSEDVKELTQLIESGQRPETNKSEGDAKEEQIADQDVWTSISDVCDKLQIYLADVFVNEKHRPEVARVLSDIAEKLRSNSSSPLQALETILGDSSVKFFAIASSARLDFAVFQTSVEDPRPSLANVA